MSNPIEEFKAIVESIYGTYLDSTYGFGSIYRNVQKIQAEIIEKTKVMNPDFENFESLDQSVFSYVTGDPDEPNSRELHVTTPAEFKKRNSPNDGTNYIFISNMCVVVIYQYWEDVYRKEIAAFLGKETHELQIPILGDLRLLRHSIIHHNGITLPEIQKCEVLKWFESEETIVLNDEKMEFIVFLLRKALSELN